MRPILADIPALPASLLLPLSILVILAGAGYAAFAARRATEDKSGAALTPLITAGAVVFLLFLSTRGNIKLHSYGLFLILGFAAATYGACLEARRKGLSVDVVLDLALPLLGASILACRLLYVLLNRNQFDSLGDVIRVWDGGLSFHGSLVAAPLVVWYFARRNNLTFWQLADIIVPSVFIGYAIGRLGCFFNGCCYGSICEMPWAMSFPDEYHRNIMTPPSHPTQLYSFLLAIGLFGLMQRAKTSPHWTRFSGQLTLLFFSMYAVERAFIEYFRNGATARPVLAGVPWLTQAQFASALALIVIAAIWAILSGRAKPAPPIATPKPGTH